ncbi:MAG: histidine kinase [Acidobacteria bacterium]|nr:histidine kinase [Acidobacteriota bacterium]
MTWCDWKSWKYVTLAWGIAFVYFVCQTTVAISLFLPNEPMPWWRIIKGCFLFCLLWLPTTQFAIGMARRFHLEGRKFLVYLVVHFVTGFVVSVVIHSIGIIAMNWYPIQAGEFTLHNYSIELLMRINLSLLIYLMLVFTTHAFDYRQESQARLIRELQLQTQLDQTKLQALKMQLHPHFLFNVLNSISVLQTQDLPGAQKMVHRLGEFLQKILYQSDSVQVRLEQELECLECYLDIERIRHRDRLVVTVVVSPEALNVYVPSLILQPVVENAVRYAMTGLDTIGEIIIRGKILGNRLQLDVIDNGPGLTLSNQKSPSARKGIGLANTKARLEQLYGREASLELVSAAEGGVKVTLTVPIQPEAELQFKNILESVMI